MQTVFRYTTIDKQPLQSDDYHLSNVISNTYDEIGELTVDGEESILSWCTFNSDKLESIIIPNSIKTIEEEAFYGCQNLTSVHIPSSVEHIEVPPFKECDIHYR